MSSVINPLNSNEILLFYLSNKGTTGLERHNFQDNQHNPTKFADKSVADDSGAFSALTSGGLVCITWPLCLEEMSQRRIVECLWLG